MKKIIATIFILLGFLLTVKPAFAQTFDFSPKTATKKVGEQFVVTVNIDVGSSKTQGADLKISYDNDDLEVVKVEKGDFFPKGGFNINEETVYISYGIDQPLVTKTGTGVFAKITLKGKAIGSALFDVVCSKETIDSNIWNESSDDIIDCQKVSSPSYLISDADDGDEDDVTPTPTKSAATVSPTPPVSGGILPSVIFGGVGAVLTVLGLVLVI